MGCFNDILCYIKVDKQALGSDLVSKKMFVSNNNIMYVGKVCI